MQNVAKNRGENKWQPLALAKRKFAPTCGVAVGDRVRVDVALTLINLTAGLYISVGIFLPL